MGAKTKLVGESTTGTENSGFMTSKFSNVVLEVVYRLVFLFTEKKK